MAFWGIFTDPTIATLPDLNVTIQAYQTDGLTRKPTFSISFFQLIYYHHHHQLVCVVCLLAYCCVKSHSVDAFGVATIRPGISGHVLFGILSGWIFKNPQFVLVFGLLPLSQINNISRPCACCYLPHSYSIQHGTDNKIGLRLSVCVCVCVCLSVCPCVVTLTVAFLCRFSSNLTQRCKPPKVRTSSLGLISPHPFLYFTPKNCHFWPRGPENQCKYEKRNICLKCSRIAKIPGCHKKSGSGNTTVTSDF